MSRIRTCLTCFNNLFFKVPVYKLSKEKTVRLKTRIAYRLLTEDYTCRLPPSSKPRIRYKLTKCWYMKNGKPFELVYV